MAVQTVYIEYSEDLSKRITESEAIMQRVIYRLSTLNGEIPYDTGSLDSYLFSVGQKPKFERELKRRLSDITTQVSVSLDGHVMVGGITVPIPGIATGPKGT